MMTMLHTISSEKIHLKNKFLKDMEEFQRLTYGIYIRIIVLNVNGAVLKKFIVSLMAHFYFGK